VIEEEIPTQSLPRLYKSVDAFVLPSRGEGWGRPHVEAMSMGLPIIVTNWSGPTAFITPDNSYPISILGLQHVITGPFTSHKWANPSLDHLRQIMRDVVQNKDVAKQKGKKAREDIVAKFHPVRVARLVVKELSRIEQLLQQPKTVEQ